MSKKHFRASRVSSTQETIDDLLARFPGFADQVCGLSDGPYTIATEFGLYVRDGIEDRTLELEELERAFSVLNDLGEIRDAEVRNLLAVGILGVLTDTSATVAMARSKLKGGGLRSFEKTLRFLRGGLRNV